MIFYNSVLFSSHLTHFKIGCHMIFHSSTFIVNMTILCKVDAFFQSESAIFLISLTGLANTYYILNLGPYHSSQSFFLLNILLQSKHKKLKIHSWNKWLSMCCWYVTYYRVRCCGLKRLCGWDERTCVKTQWWPS